MSDDFQNPNQPDPGMQGRLMIAIVLTFLIILASQPLLQKFGPKRETPTSPATQPAQATAAKANSPGEAPAGTAAPTPSIAVPAGQKQGTSETETVVENDLYRITFSNRGGEVKSWVLKKYNDDKGKPLELVNEIAAPQYGYPLSLWTYDQDLRKKLAGALYVASATGAQKSPTTLTFEYSDGDVAVTKKFTFDHTYVLKLETEVRRGGQLVQAYPSWPAGFGDQTVASSYAGGNVVWQSGEKVTRLSPKKIPGGATQPGPLHWAAAGDQYFAAAFLPDEPENSAMVELHEQISIPKNLDKPDPTQTIQVPVVGAAVGNINGVTHQRVFVGPKAIDVLSSVHGSLTPQERASMPKGGEGEYHGPDLQGLVDFGFFSIISKPLFLWLKWTQQHWVPNWGWAIIVLTIIINVALAPLRVSSMKSSLKMQKVQPQMKAIQEKYKKYKLNDPRRQDMQQEVAELYKREGINPIGGCLPLVIQLPFLYAFYEMLAVAIELRHAPWLWIHDMSSADPLHILPILIVISMFGTQRLTPQGGMDPVQQKMMSIMMPAFLGFISWNLSSGLDLYWTIGNFLAIVQQLWINQTKFGRELREHMAKRAQKKGK